VVDDSLWIGNAADARNALVLHEHGINVVIDLALDEPPAVLPRDLIYLRFPIVDGLENDRSLLTAAIKTTAILLSLPDFKITVCCSAGLSRSPAIVAAAIAVNRGQSAEEALGEVTARATCDVSPALWTEISDICSLLQT
jgi:protein-tyrosine phosphatase